MAGKTPLAHLKEDERRARVRLASYRARLFDGKVANPVATEIRLRELERRWKGAAERLRKARKVRKPGA
jgi:hypothetical protein